MTNIVMYGGLKYVDLTSGTMFDIAIFDPYKFL